VKHFSLQDVCYHVTSRQSKKWGEIGKQVMELDSDCILLLFVDKEKQAFLPDSLSCMRFPKVPQAPPR